MVSNQQGTKLKLFRTNNGLKFVSIKFNKFCKVEDRNRHKMVTCTPQ